jgi:hypothetical protein
MALRVTERLTTEYRSWQNMLNRTCNKNEKDDKNWGDRGITTCIRSLGTIAR